MADDPLRTFQEWNTEADRKAYRDLKQGDVVKVTFPYYGSFKPAVGPARVVFTGDIEASEGQGSVKVSTAVLRQVTQRIGHELDVNSHLPPA